MATQSLLLSSDPVVLGALRPLMLEMGMEVEVCSQAPEAILTLRQRTFDTLIVDCDQSSEALGVLAEARKAPTASRVVAVGITRDPNAMQAVFESGATFVLHKPLPLEDARRILRISKGATTRAVRRFLRLPVNTLSIATVDEKQEAVILNISQRGLAIQCSEALSMGQMVYVSFLLPETFTLVEGMAQVMWADPSGRAGVEFRTISDESQADMAEWIYARAKVTNPALAPPKTRKTTTITVTSEEEAGPGKMKTYSAALLGAAVDLLMVLGGTIFLTGLIAMMGHRILQWSTVAMALTIGLVLWTLYRFLFTFFGVKSPGHHARTRIEAAENVPAWLLRAARVTQMVSTGAQQ